MANYGTLTLFDQAAANQTVESFGESAAYQVVRANLDAYNATIREAIQDVAVITSDTQKAYGSIGGIEMVPVDEYGVADAQHNQKNSTVGFPLYRFTATIQWTKLWMQYNKVADLEEQYLAARNADYIGILKSVKRALFKPTNTIGYLDRYASRLTYNLRALLNGDGEPIPTSPNGTDFASNHTHYLASSTLTSAAVKSLINTVIEHGHGGDIVVYINKSDEAAFRALAEFRPYIDARTTIASTDRVAVGSLDTTNLDNRAIGIFEGAEVWVKPWIPVSYAFCYSKTGPKPLGFRVREGTTLSELAIEAELEQHPLRAQIMSREYGIAAWNRTNGAVLYFGGASYVEPA